MLIAASAITASLLAMLAKTADARFRDNPAAGTGSGLWRRRRYDRRVTDFELAHRYDTVNLYRRGAAAKVELNRPHGATTDPSGAIVICDSDNHRVLRIEK